MNGNWAKILLFSLLFLILGFLLGRMCGAGCTDGKCGPGGMRGGDCSMHGGMSEEACAHGKKGKCCTMKGDSATTDADSAAMHP